MPVAAAGGRSLSRQRDGLLRRGLLLPRAVGPFARGGRPTAAATCPDLHTELARDRTARLVLARVDQRARGVEHHIASRSL
eukprot:896899-Prymnesium_polylepis.1